MEFLQPLPRQQYKVLVSTSTYNHSKYITQTLDSFSMQQKNFPFVCVVLEDCSTDGEQDVIKDWIKRNSNNPASLFSEEYADVYVVEHKNNSNCTLVFYLLKENHRKLKKSKAIHAKAWLKASKYYALCEGDDYWTDPMKLQAQVDFLDTHPDYSAVATQSMVIYETEDNPHPFSKHTKDYDWELGALVGYRPFHTATLMYRPCSELDNRPRVYSGDMCLIITLSQKGKIRLMSNCTSIYRKHSGGASSNVSLSDLRRDLVGIPYYIKINRNFPIRRHKAYLYYTFSIFPPQNKLCDILKYGVKSIWFNITSFSVETKNILKILYLMFNKIRKRFN